MLQRDLKFDGGEGEKVRKERKKERQKERRIEGEGKIHQ